MENEAASGVKHVLEASAYILFIMLVLTVVAWIKIPDGQRIVTHWNAMGQPDGYSSKPIALLVLPVGTVVLAGVLVLLASIVDLSSVKTVMWVAGMALFVVMQGIVIWIALGEKMDVNTVIWGVGGLVFVVYGNYLPKLRKNYIAGIRTPWTLSSELSWNKTHRLGGKVYILFGLVMLFCALFLDAINCLEVVGSVGLALIIFLTVYSYTVWKRDPSHSASLPRFFSIG